MTVRPKFNVVLKTSASLANARICARDWWHVDTYQEKRPLWQKLPVGKLLLPYYIWVSSQKILLKRDFSFFFFFFLVLFKIIAEQQERRAPVMIRKKECFAHFELFRFHSKHKILPSSFLRVGQSVSFLYRRGHPNHICTLEGRMPSPGTTSPS